MCNTYMTINSPSKNSTSSNGMQVFKCQKKYLGCDQISWKPFLSYIHRKCYSLNTFLHKKLLCPFSLSHLARPSQQTAAHTVHYAAGRCAVPPHSNQSTHIPPGKLLHLMLHLSYFKFCI